MNSSNNKVYKLTNKNTKEEHIGTTWKLAQNLYMSQGSINYIVKQKETRDYICEYIGTKRVIYKVSYEGKIYNGLLEDVAKEIGVSPRTILEMHYRQKKGIATKIVVLAKKEEIIYGHQSM